MTRDAVVRELKNATPRAHVSAVLAYVEGDRYEQHLSYEDWARMLTATDGRVGIQVVDIDDGDYRSWVVRYDEGVLEAQAIHKDDAGTISPTELDDALDSYHAEPIPLTHDPLFETDEELTIGENWLTGTEVAD
jgi:hypothetical protein